MTGAFADPSKITLYTEKDYILPETPPFSWLIKNSRVSTISDFENAAHETVTLPSRLIFRVLFTCDCSWSRRSGRRTTRTIRRRQMGRRKSCRHRLIHSRKMYSTISTTTTTTSATTTTSRPPRRAKRGASRRATRQSCRKWTGSDSARSERYRTRRTEFWRKWFVLGSLLVARFV